MIRQQHNDRSVPRMGRRGVVIVELILWLPVLAVFLAALVEFSLIYKMNQQVSYASRFGAKWASEANRTQLPTLAEPLKDAIDQHLAVAGLTSACRVMLEHNVCAANPQQQAGGNCACETNGLPLPGNLPPTLPEGGFVKVTVCVPLAGNVPNLLDVFGFDLTGKSLTHSTLFKLEAPNAPPISGFVAGQGSNLQVPITSDQTQVINLFAAAGTSPAPISLNLGTSDVLTHDDGTPFPELSLSWLATPGPLTSPSQGTGSTFQVTLTPPNAPTAPAPAVNQRAFSLTLRVTDSCGAVSTRTLDLLVRVQRSP